MESVLVMDMDGHHVVKLWTDLGTAVVTFHDEVVLAPLRLLRRVYERLDIRALHINGGGPQSPARTRLPCAYDVQIEKKRT